MINNNNTFRFQNNIQTQRIEEYNDNYNYNYNEPNYLNENPSWQQTIFTQNPSSNNFSLTQDMNNFIIHRTESMIVESTDMNMNTDMNIDNHEPIEDLRNNYDILNKPVMKLCQFKLNSLTNEREIISEHFVTPYGMIGTHRNINDNFVKIGRLQLDENNVVQNDIILSPNDRSISRCHCKIDISDGFKKIEKFPDTYLSLLMINHPRLGKYSQMNKVSNNVLYNIISYLPRKRQFHLVDCGSIIGTYVRQRIGEVNYVKENEIFAIGSEFVIAVKEIIGVLTHQRNYTNESTMFSYLFGEKMKGTEIIGITGENANFFNHPLPLNENEAKEFVKKIPTNKVHPVYPFIKIEINSLSVSYENPKS
jgi:hypothetical protein